MDLTKEKAIQLTYELWNWMKEKKRTNKTFWPGWAEYGSMRFDCPCCQYERNQRSGYTHTPQECIAYCPLLNIWPAKRDSNCPPCCRKGSPFQRFEEFSDDEKFDEVSKIVIEMEAAIKKEMKRLKIKPLNKTLT